jgi:hypothetical protein
MAYSERRLASATTQNEKTESVMNTRERSSIWLASLVLCLLASAVGASAPDRLKLEKISKLSVPFTRNAGQWDARVEFSAQTFAGTLFVTKQGEIVYSLPGLPKSTAGTSRGYSGGWILSEIMVDAAGDPCTSTQHAFEAPTGLNAMHGNVSYLIGDDPSKHAKNVVSYERVSLGEIYPGVNFQLRATGSNVEKIFTVAPGRDPHQINIKLAGAEKLEIGPQGELVAHTGNGAVTFTAPIAFQEADDGTRTPVAVAYTMKSPKTRGKQRDRDSYENTSDLQKAIAFYGFDVGSYDPTRPLVIDPLLQSTYLGGTGTDYVYAMAIHPISGEIYIAGYTNSTDLPSVTNRCHLRGRCVCRALQR